MLNICEKFKIDAAQVPINIFDKRFTNKHLVKTLKVKKVKIIARSVFLKGALLKSSNKIPKKFIALREKIKVLEKIILEKKLNQLEECLKFVLSQKFIDKIIIGISNSAQLIKIIKIFNKKLNISAEIKALDIKDKKIIDPRYWSK